MTPRLLAALLLTGCAVLPPGRAIEMPGQAQAVATVWGEVYGRTDPAPEVLWVMPADLPCTDPVSGYPGFEFLGGCHEGLTLGPGRVYVAYRPDEPLSRTAMRHEMWHCALMRMGQLDPFHKGAGWDEGGIVDQARWALEEMGL